MKTYALLFFLIAATQSFGTPIQYTFSGTASGIVGPMNFSGPISIVALGDTNGIISIPQAAQNASLSTTIGISGVGTLAITDSIVLIRAISNLGLNDTSIGRVLFSITSPNVENSSLATNFGPIFDALPFGVDQFRNVGTSDGILNLTSLTDVTFTASVVPEPRTIELLLSAAIALIGGFRCRRPVAK
jgi:hypothetical protein